MSEADVIIVGGGPAGVGAALALRRSGVAEVTLLDREPALGGATRHCSHSPFGMREFGRVYLGAAYGKRLADEARAAGVTVLTGHSVTALGEDGSLAIVNPEGTGRMQARRILLATGAREASRAARLLPGDRPVGVLTTGALQAFVAFHGLMPFRRPVILGSELVAMSAILTCLGHGARPVAVVEPGPGALARAPFSWLPRAAGIPFLRGAEVSDIIGRDRVQAVKLRQGGHEHVLDCDGLLLTGAFVPEAALLWQAGHAINTGSGGPAVDQAGRCANPLFFAAGNLLRPVETGGWSFREGIAIGKAIADDLGRAPAMAPPVAVSHDAPIRLVVPNLLRRGLPPAPGFDRFQLRLSRACRGEIRLSLDGRVVSRHSGHWRPERRVLIPMPPGAAEAGHIHFAFSEAP